MCVCVCVCKHQELSWCARLLSVFFLAYEWDAAWIVLQWVVPAVGAICRESPGEGLRDWCMLLLTTLGICSYKPRCRSRDWS